MIEKKMLFAPGPVLTSERVKKIALSPDICHRSIMFEDLYSELRQKLNMLFKADADYISVVVSGSGTASNETVLSSVFEKGESLLLITNGEFGNRLKEIAECYHINMNIIGFNWGEYPDMNKIEDALKKDKKIKLVSMVYHETSTGMINPVHEVGELAKKYDKLYHVDAISAVGGEDVDVIRDKIDFCTGVPNKSVSGHPGVSFVCINKGAFERIKNIKGKNVYLNLQKHIKMAEDKNQTPNTPSVIMFLVLNEALQELFDEGIENRIERYKKDASILRAQMKDLKLEFLIKDESLMSNTVTSIFLPKRISVYDFVDRMYERGYVVYLGKGPLLERNMFQVANMGQIYPEDCEKFNETFKEVYMSF